MDLRLPIYTSIKVNMYISIFNKLKTINIYKARQLNDFFRSIDDITSINALDKILEYPVEIYGNTVLLIV